MTSYLIIGSESVNTLAARNFDQTIPKDCQAVFSFFNSLSELRWAPLVHIWAFPVAGTAASNAGFHTERKKKHLRRRCRQFRSIQSWRYDQVGKKGKRIGDKSIVLQPYQYK